MQTGPLQIGGDDIVLGTPLYSGLSTTLGRHMLIELARIQTYTKLWVESDFDICRNKD